MLKSQPINTSNRQVAKTGLCLSALGFGGASVGNLYRASSDEEAQNVLNEAFSAGITYFDTAPHYGHGLSENRIGKWLKGIRRADIILSTKVGRVLDPVEPGTEPDHGFVDPLPFKQVFDYSFDGVMRSFEESCERLGVDHIDILYMHDIGARTHGPDDAALFDIAMTDGFRAMRELKETGRVTALGLGVNEWEVCDAALDRVEPDVFMIAGRFTLLENSEALNFLERCKDRAVSIVSASPFNSGLMAKMPTSNSHYDYEAAPDAVVAKARRIHEICNAHRVSPQALALQFPLLHEAVVSVVAGMSRPERVTQGTEWVKTPIDMAVIGALIEQDLADPRLPELLNLQALKGTGRS